MASEQAHRIPHCIVTALLAGALASPVYARALRVSVQRVSAPGVVVEDLHFDLDATSATAQVAANVKPGAAAAAMPANAHCTLSHGGDEGWRCAGEGELAWSARGAAPKAALLLHADAGNFLLELSRDKAKLVASTPRSEPFATARAKLTGWPLTWMQAPLTNIWPQAKLGGGSIDVETRYDSAKANGIALDYSLRDAALDTQDGSVAIAGLAASGKLSLDTRAALRVHHAGALRGGELLWGGFYTKLPPSPIKLNFDLAPGAQANLWLLDSLSLDDAGTLALDLSARIDEAAANPLAALQVQHFDATFPAAHERYAKSLLSAKGFGELAPRGHLRGSVRFDAEGLAAFTIEPQALSVTDGAGRFALDGVDGSLAWAREGDLPATTLSWNAAQVYRLALGGARTQWRSRAGELALAASASVPFEGGTLEIPHMAVRPDAAKGERLRAGFAAHDVDLGALSSAFGWPKFAGKLGGAVPAIRYVGEHIELEGGLFLNLFDGSVNITNLALERPFGVAPSLAADIALEKLDLQPLTAAFGFGEITGRLSGRIGDLRTVDWAPVAFDAELHSIDGGKLSQRAVNNLTSVGGGGLAAGLQASVLRIFDTFGYSRLGLRCRLHNNVCQMGGIDSSGAGYTIVQGRGLPHITVVGHAGEVDWPTLVARLKAATSGTAPIIR